MHRRRTSDGHAVHDVPAERPIVGRIAAGHLRHTVLYERGPLRAARAAALGLDDDDAVRRRRSIERGRGRPADHVDRFDIFGIQRRETIDADSGDVPRLGFVAEPNAVNDDEWLVVQGQRADAADANVWRRADDTLRLNDLHAGRARLEQSR